MYMQTRELAQTYCSCTCIRGFRSGPEQQQHYYLLLALRKAQSVPDSKHVHFGAKVSNAYVKAEAEVSPLSTCFFDDDVAIPSSKNKVYM